MNKDKKNITLKQNYKESKKSILNKLFNSKNSKYIVGTILGVMLLTLTLTFTNSSVVNKSYASGAYTWGGWYTDSSSGFAESRGYDTGYFYINILKGDTVFKSATYKVSANFAFDTSKPNLYYLHVRNTNTSWFFSKSNGSSDSENWIKVGANEETAYGTRKIGITGTENDGHYFYMAPPFNIKIPKGYYFSSSTVGYDTSKFGSNVTLTPFFCKSSPYESGNTDSLSGTGCYTGSNYNKMLYANSPSKDNSASMSFTASDSNRWTTGGRLQTNIIATRALTRVATNGKHYRSSQSYSVKFLPNKTTFSFNANGGTGGPTGTFTKTYDSELTLSTAKPTREGYTFVKWCTDKNGGGDCFTSGGKIPADKWSEYSKNPKTLFAQWRSTGQSAEDWCGYTLVGSEQSEEKGWKEGKGYIHLGICDPDTTNPGDSEKCNKYSTTEFKSTLNYGTTSTDGNNTYYNYINSNPISSTFSVIDGDEDNLKINTANPVTTSKVSLSGGSTQSYSYLNGPTVQIKVPKGYYYYNHTYSYPDGLWPGNTEFSVRKDEEATLGTNVGYLLDDYKTPSDSDRTPTGKLNINISSLGHRTYNKYRAYKAYCIAFKPNTRNIVYEANYSDFNDTQMDNGKYVYSDSSTGATIKNNEYVRDGYKFLGWNTKADGTGDKYDEGDTISGDEWPAESSDLVLYAQWGEPRTATILYVETNDDNEKEIKTASVECTINSNNKCIANIPQDVLDSLGYAGLASTTGTMDTVIGNKDNTIDLTDTSGSVKYYAVYSMPVTNYYRDN